MEEYKKILQAGREAQRAEHNKHEIDKIGTLRGGSCGILTEEGDVIGGCHRIAHLRQIGIQAPSEPETHNMFAAGHANEDIIAKELIDGGAKIKRETEIPVQIELEDGTKITGRPDIVVVDSDDTPLFIVEMKCISARGTAVAVHYELKPKTNHLIQLALYMIGLGIDESVLHYASRVKWNIPAKMPSSVKKVTSKGWDAVEQYGGVQIQPFDRIYNVKWAEDDTIEWSTQDGKGMKTRSTIISKDNIMAYYRVVNEIQRHHDLGPIPAKDGYLQCDYCPFSEQCERYEETRDYDMWLDEITLHVGVLEKQYYGK